MQEIQGKEQAASTTNAMQQQTRELRLQVQAMKTPMMDPSKNPALAEQTQHHHQNR